MNYQSLVFIFVLGVKLVLTLEDDASMPEQLFLDVPLNEILGNASTRPLVEPWSSAYVEAVRSRRLGDAIWARYQMEGGVKDGIIEQANMTVMDSIKEDAVGYKENAPQQYEEALSFYANPSVHDSHPEVLQAITQITSEDVARFGSLSKRDTFGTKCSTHWLALAHDCQLVLDNMFRSKVLVGNVRDISIQNGCRIRVGPYHSAPDITYHTVYAVALLIEERCHLHRGCCDWVSGYSPRSLEHGSGHRKICLSGKQTGCS
ncbi:hypothetical protein FPHYL_13530 [Fusarium phyllophilum]|uniref:Uncharacterized protein n=1 Tax=Fusarium phyllophilum TaxID=47803 RepID=A0A8H5IDN8_9HYPO|nr:hypothetical protein FPHYL_13530 [Fusarium phyllophilum]